MKQFIASILVAAGLCATAATLTPAEETLAKRIPEAFARSAQHYRDLLKQMESQAPDKMPKRFQDGKLVTIGFRDWCSGFFPGTMWYLYEYTQDKFWLDSAKTWTDKLEVIRHYTDNHDIGFMLYCSAGNGWRLAKVPGYDTILRDAAAALCTRYEPKLGLIRSWNNWAKHTHFQVIIDNMMNLELLEWAAKNGGDARFADIAFSHADKTNANHFRADGSTFHVLDYNPDTGKIFAYFAGQGASASGTWARGQSWAIYGFTMMARETGRPDYLGRACKCADYAINHSNMPADGVPYWDYHAAGIPNEERDASAGAIMASALLELSTLVKDPVRAAGYRAFAVKQLTSLSSDAYFAQLGENGSFLIKHCVGHKPGKSEVDVPLNYADYYFIEGLLRFAKLTK